MNIKLFSIENVYYKYSDNLNDVLAKSTKNLLQARKKVYINFMQFIEKQIAIYNFKFLIKYHRLWLMTETLYFFFIIVNMSRTLIFNI